MRGFFVFDFSVNYRGFQSNILKERFNCTNKLLLPIQMQHLQFQTLKTSSFKCMQLNCFPD